MCRKRRAAREARLFSLSSIILLFCDEWTDSEDEELFKKDMTAVVKVALSDAVTLDEMHKETHQDS